jgi:hypothetical protein
MGDLCLERAIDEDANRIIMGNPPHGACFDCFAQSGWIGRREKRACHARVRRGKTFQPL